MALERKAGLAPISAKRLEAFGGRAPRSTLDKPGARPSAWPARRAPSPTDPDEATVKAVLKRADGRCESCGDELVGRRGFEFSVHHRKLRSQGGDNRLSNLVALCGHGTSGCHGYAHSEVAKSRVAGFLVRRRENPAAKPVDHSWLGHVLLLDDGTWQQVEAEFIPAAEVEGGEDW